MVSSKNCPQIRAGRTRDIRIEPMVGNVSVNTMSTHPLVAGCANRMFHCMSPVVVSMYYSPHPAAFHIAHAAWLREFCLYDFAPGELLCKDDDNPFPILPVAPAPAHNQQLCL
jgi:hypothetical protein